MQAYIVCLHFAVQDGWLFFTVTPRLATCCQQVALLLVRSQFVFFTVIHCMDAAV